MVSLMAAGVSRRSWTARSAVLVGSSPRSRAAPAQASGAPIAPTERFAIRFDLDTAFDKTYYTNSYADVWVEPGAPRRYRVTASYSF